MSKWVFVIDSHSLIRGLHPLQGDYAPSGLDMWCLNRGMLPRLVG
jgi:hypothetical protein